MRRWTIWAVAVVLVVTCAPRADGGSLYSLFGLGQKVVLNSAHYRSLGGGGLALPDLLSVNPLNPAASVPAPVTRVSGTFFYEGASLRTRIASGWHNYSGPFAFDFHVPLGRRWAVAAGFRPVTFRDYRLREAGTFLSHSFGAETEIGYEQVREGKGGLSALSFDVCRTFGSKASLGLGGRFIFGRLQDSWSLNFDRGDFRSTEDQYDLHLRGAAFVLGVVIRPAERWSVGGFFQTKAKLKTERRGESRYVYSDTVRTFTTDYPPFWGIGSAVQLGGGWTAVVDYLAQDWSGWKWMGRTAAGAGRWYHLSLGVQRTPTAGAFASFWKKVVTRAGLYQRAWAFSPVEEKRLMERALTFGAGFPLPENRGRVDVALEIGRRGDKNVFPLEERFIRIILTFVAGEKWFIRPE